MKSIMILNLSFDLMIYLIFYFIKKCLW